MVKITYDNFRAIECEFVKYVSQKKGKFKINVIDFSLFKEELVSKYLEEEIQRFFRLFPYDLDSEVRSADKIASIKLEIEFYDDLRLITLGGFEYVLVDQSTEKLEGSAFLNEISSQPIVLEEFVVISFFDFVMIAQADLHYGINFNLRNREDGEAKNLEWEINHGLYT